ncbi:hypothetical protein [Vreelandella neptunia]|uniref:Uncharacterized protein n=1 Tax=Vreelandella neptunia TaxID=115551 RepID=A0ABZ0YPN5_9GAMM|nr:MULTISPECIES: hypothetical protein [Halomonas]MDN3559149.1 hypothetical protein [Halomonas neptunia]WQH14110.1 hypothetical protein SR894_06105 [Halomonas neptunia]
MATIMLLPNEPSIENEAAQEALTTQWLLPVLGELKKLFIDLRHSLDPELVQARPYKQGKAYPLGQCLEISQAAFQRLPRLGTGTLQPAAARGLQALMHFVRHGGCVRQVWGDLRGDYFQNALLVGTLYVDVANDTVDPTKPPVEILPFAHARLKPISDFVHFSRVAARYWQAQLYPNHILPGLAPYFPLVSVTQSGVVQFQSASNYMIALTEAGQFAPSETVLKGNPMNASLFALLRNTLLATNASLPDAPDQGRVLALRTCLAAHNQQWHTSQQRRNSTVTTVIQVNRALGQLVIRGQGE